MESLTLKSVGLAAIIIVAFVYLLYMFGLILVLRRLNKMTWQAYIPIFNYYATVRAVGAPGRWFWLSLIPYFGAMYAGTVAIRLGQVFGKRPGFSLFWLTLGAAIGMFVLAFSKTPHDEKLLNSEIYLLNVKSARKKNP